MVALTSPGRKADESQLFGMAKGCRGWRAAGAAAATGGQGEDPLHRDCDCFVSNHGCVNLPAAV